MILNLVYLLLSLFFTCGTYDSLPRNGCYLVGGFGAENQSIICSDFQSFQFISILWFALALFFAMLVLVREIKKVTLQYTNEYNAKDLHSQYFLNTQLTASDVQVVKSLPFSVGDITIDSPAFF